MVIHFEASGVEMKFPVVFEPTGTGYSVYVIDMDGCIATDSTLDEIRENMRGALALHVAGMREDGDPVPAPSIVELVDVAVVV